MNRLLYQTRPVYFGEICSKPSVLSEVFNTFLGDFSRHQDLFLLLVSHFFVHNHTSHLISRIFQHKYLVSYCCHCLGFSVSVSEGKSASGTRLFSLRDFIFLKNCQVLTILVGKGRDMILTTEANWDWRFWLITKPDMFPYFTDP
jgi:hypothetical protein